MTNKEAAWKMANNDKDLYGDRSRFVHESLDNAQRTFNAAYDVIVDSIVSGKVDSDSGFQDLLRELQVMIENAAKYLEHAELNLKLLKSDVSKPEAFLRLWKGAGL